jgi:predicted SAM-dependent methyltransferase
MINWLYALARPVYRALPLPPALKQKLRAAFGTRSVQATPESALPLSPTHRRAKMLSRIDPASQEGLEIGPLFSPIVTKAEAPGKVWYVDYAAADGLKEKYRLDPNVRVDEIVEVDYLWGKRSLSELVDGKQFDYVIASHVIEHVPDMLGWLKEVAQVLKDKGVLSLAVPDKRYSFDILRELSTMGMLLEAHLLHRRRPGPREIFDHFSLASKVDVGAAWTGQLDPAKLARYHELNQAYQLAQESLHTEEYHDTHVNTFTPASFLNLLETAARLDLFGFVVADFCDTPRNNLEFFVTLERLSRAESRQVGLGRQLASLAWARDRIDDTKS